MKDFLKFTFATITGIIVSVVVLVFISILVVFSMVSSSESETQVRKKLHYDAGFEWCTG